MMTKSDTIEAILTLNPTASRTFLAKFSNAELAQYLQRLQELTGVTSATITTPSSDTEAERCAVAAAEHDS